MSFYDEMEKTLDEENNFSVTENGALGYKTTQSSLVDLNFQVSSLRSMSESEISSRFMKAFYEDRILAVKWLFYLRDVRGGLGERRSFRAILVHMARNNPEIVISLIPIIPEYGRWDEVLLLADYDGSLKIPDKVRDAAKNHVINAMCKDIVARNNDAPCSLLAKWMPSINSKNPKVRKEAKFWVNVIYHDDNDSNERRYRKLLSTLRKYLDVVECKMVAHKWDQISYESVPSKANLVYRKAFLRHDEERRTEYLEAANKGKSKINSSVAFPHEIVHQYTEDCYSRVNPLDSTLEAMWKNLPDKINSRGDNVIVVRDGSGSMDWGTLGNTHVTALEVATALAIYFSERIKGQFKDKFITFSDSPKLIDLSGCDNLHDKLDKTYLEDDCTNTNIVAVFNLILKTAVNSQMNQEDLPSTILILSDMEFDADRNNMNQRLFPAIRSAYRQQGYEIPRLVFWNLNSRTETIPLRQNDMGVLLISGFSANLAKMVMSNQTDPYQALLEVLNSPRYAPVEERLK